MVANVFGRLHVCVNALYRCMCLYVRVYARARVCMCMCMYVYAHVPMRVQHLYVLFHIFRSKIYICNTAPVAISGRENHSIDGSPDDLVDSLHPDFSITGTHFVIKPA